MYCEMCGQETNLFIAEIEGVQLKVCKKCAQFGKVIKSVRIQPRKESRVSNVKQTTKEPEKEIIQEVVPAYFSIIRKAREKSGLTQAEFAKRINEKESIVQKMETGKFMPSINLAEKLEKLLNIKLVEEHETDDKLLVSKSSAEALTIGDLIKIKK